MNSRPRNITSIAAHFCTLSDWGLSNLRLQKIAYIAQIISVGENDVRLIRQPFEAWKYGPVVSSLYQKLKVYGVSPAPKDALRAQAVTEDEEAFIERIYNMVGGLTGAQLINITHWKDGAWYQCYHGDPGLPHNIEGLNAEITLKSIGEEYDARKQGQSIQD